MIPSARAAPSRAMALLLCSCLPWTKLTHNRPLGTPQDIGIQANTKSLRRPNTQIPLQKPAPRDYSATVTPRPYRTPKTMMITTMLRQMRKGSIQGRGIEPAIGLSQIRAPPILLQLTLLYEAEMAPTPPHIASLLGHPSSSKAA